MTYLYRIEYQKCGPLKYISHLDLNLLFKRILLRAQIPVELTKGYNTRIKVSFGPALPLGIEGWREIIEIHLLEQLPTEVLENEINKVSPFGFKVLKAEPILNNSSSLSKLLKQVSYLIYFAPLCSAVHDKMIYYQNKIECVINKIINEKMIMVNKETKKGLVEIDLRPYIDSINVLSQAQHHNNILIRLVLNIISGGAINPRPIIDILKNDIEEYVSIERVVREKFIKINDTI